MIDMEGVLGLTAGLGKELLSNMLLPLCERTAGTDDAKKGSLLLHCSSCRGRCRMAHLSYYSHSRGRHQSQPYCHI